jgi:hypothetical protein
MRLQKNKAYVKDNRIQYKYLVNIPEEIIKELNWKEGSELKHSVIDNSLHIELLSEPRPRLKKMTEPKMSYEEFRDKIRNILEYSDGMTWTEIREKLNLEQVVPNNKWVSQMQNDIGLLRLKDTKGVKWTIKHVK